MVLLLPESTLPKTPILISGFTSDLISEPLSRCDLSLNLIYSYFYEYPF